MTDVHTSNNAWVDLYLTALLGGGLSSEYTGEENHSRVEASAAYFIDNIIDNEEGLIQTWRKAQATTDSLADPTQQRREYQAWRIWSLRMARYKAEKEAQAKRLVEEMEDDDSSMLTAGHTLRGDMLPDRGLMIKNIKKAQAEVDLGTPMGDMTPVEGSSWDKNAHYGLSRQVSMENRHASSGRINRVDPNEVQPTTPNSITDSGTDHNEPNPFTGRVERFYIVLISAHGLVRGENMELGKDADTGGQVKYVVELAKTLASHPMVHRVELMTRLIEAPEVDRSYSVREETLIQGSGQHGGAYIIRVPAGDTKKYLPKEALWPHLREFADYGLMHIMRQMKTMQEASEPCKLYAVHGHYADAGEAAALISHTMGATMVLTGHSLGRNKLDHLLRVGTMTRAQIEETYAISRRIEGEERALDAAVMVVTSTQQEVDQQWGLYDGYSDEMAAALRKRRIPGRAMPRMQVIPPGLDFSSLKVELPADPFELFEDYKRAMANPSETLHAKVGTPTAASSAATSTVHQSVAPTDDPLGGTSPTKASNSAHSTAGEKPGLMSQAWAAATSDKQSAAGEARSGPLGMARSRSHRSMAGLAAHPSNASLIEGLEGGPEIWKSVHRFLSNPAKPVILAMSRPDAKKNITTLVKAFGSNETLRGMANLVLIMGNRDSIDSLAKGSQQVITQVLKLIDKYDLYGRVAYPKAHKQSDISDIYLLAKETRGVFVNIALQEPFGLTLIEAAVHGVPIVATKHGGPVDIIKTLKNGTIVEPTDEKAVSSAILDIVLNKDRWTRMSSSGIKNILAYSWPSHCLRYLEHVERTLPSQPMLQGAQSSRMRARYHSFDAGKTSELDAHAIESEAAASGWPEGTEQSGAIATTDDLHVDASRQTAGDFIERSKTFRAAKSTLRIVKQKRTRILYGMLESTVDMDLLVSSLEGAIKQNDGTFAVGVLTVLTFREITRELKKAGLDPEALDFLVCSCGAYILYYDEVHKSWQADEVWEEKAQHRWDKGLVVRTLTRMQMNRVKRRGDENKQSDVMRLLSDGQNADDGGGPLHVLLAFDPEEGDSEKMTVDNATLIQRVRKRVRRVGIRANLTLQLVPEEATDGKRTAVLHATPLRCSRALALRHIAITHNLKLSQSAFLCTPASLHAKGDEEGVDYTTIGSLTSDLVTLIEGAQHCVVVPPSRTVNLSLNLSQALDDVQPPQRHSAAYRRMLISLEPFSEERVHVLNSAKEINSTLESIGGQQSDK